MKLDRITRIAVSAAVAALLVSYAGFKIPLLFPAFLKIDLGDAPALLIASVLGYMAGFWVELVKLLLYMVVRGGDIVSTLANLVAGAAFLLPLAVFRPALPTRRHMWLPLLLAPTVAAVVMIPANGLVFLPYHGIFGAKAWTMAIYTLGPFNLLKFGISALSVYVLLPFLAPVLSTFGSAARSSLPPATPVKER